MTTSISRTFEIRGKKSATLKELRKEGFTISQNKFLYNDYNFTGERAALIERLCKSGRLVCTDKSVYLKDFDKYYKGRIVELFKDVKGARERYALGLAESFNTKIRPLYTSQRAGVMVQYNEFNEYMLEGKDWNAYSKMYGRPAVWKDAAVVIRGNEFDIFTSRGTNVATYNIPHLSEIQKRHFGDTLVPGELYSVKLRNGVYARYDKKGKFTGYAVELLKPGHTNYCYFEHGATISEIKSEYRHKQQLHKQQKLEKQMASEIVRATRLIMRIVSRADVSYEDARAVGYCKAGIIGFCNRTGIVFSEQATVKFGFLKRYPEAQRLRQAVAEKLAKSILLK